jgi:phosphotransferase system HPr (HPr) family protein
MFSGCHESRGRSDCSVKKSVRPACQNRKHGCKGRDALRSQIWISDEHQNANARSVVEMTSLGARQGRQLKLKAQGPDAKDAVKEIRLLFETTFGEK